MDDFLKAGKITGEAREYARSIIKEGMNIYEFVMKIEEKIRKLGAKLAFPVNISVDDEAAHNTAEFEGEETFQKGQVVKVDIGAQVNGYVGDTAFTKEIAAHNYKDLIKSTEEALKNAIDCIKPNVEVGRIGAIIEETIKSYGFNPVRNLGGHGVGRYDLHQGLFIPNYNNFNPHRLSLNQTIAIEPFATTGDGLVADSKTVRIYALANPKPVRMRSSRKIMNYIKEEFRTLPFADYHLYKKFSRAEVSIALREMTANGSLQSFPVLKEVSKGIVSQAEHTLIVRDEPVITTFYK